ncbi:MAG: lysozyme inhibitor LprI family protein [Anaerolineaceae bacterium]|nr:lysozyme inhibitor LprI family protein [Anaerolineaceae bacterium]
MPTMTKTMASNTTLTPLPLSTNTIQNENRPQMRQSNDPIQEFSAVVKALHSKDKKSIVNMVSFPFIIETTYRYDLINSPEDFLKVYDVVFSPEYINGIDDLYSSSDPYFINALGVRIIANEYFGIFFSDNGSVIGIRNKYIKNELYEQLITPTPQSAERTNNCHDDAKTQYDLNMCVGSYYSRSTEILDILMSDLEYRMGNEFYQNLLKDQKIWLASAKSFCTWEASDYEGGSMQPMIFYSCMTLEYKHRINDLRPFLCGGGGCWEAYLYEQDETTDYIK